MKKWKELTWDFETQRKYHGVKAVIQTRNICTIDGFDYTEEAVEAINKRFGCKVFATNYDNESADKLRRFAKKMMRK